MDCISSSNAGQRIKAVVNFKRVSKFGEIHSGSSMIRSIADHMGSSKIPEWMKGIADVVEAFERGNACCSSRTNYLIIAAIVSNDIAERTNTVFNNTARFEMGSSVQV